MRGGMRNGIGAGLVAALLASTAIGIAGTGITIAAPAAASAATNSASAPKTVQPYLWSASKFTGGGISLAGFVPNEDERQVLLDGIGNLIADKMVTAGGEPDGFAAAAAASLDVLDDLDTGKVSFDGTTWRIEGAVDSTEKAEAVKATFDSSALASVVATYQVSAPPSAKAASIAAPDVMTAPAMNASSAPAPAAVSPTYKWSAEKDADGLLTFNGTVPTDKLKRFLLTEAGGKSLDNSTVAAGAPTDFNGGALNGLQALLKLQSGRLAFADGQWSLDGVAATTSGPASVRAALAEIDTHNWKFDIRIAPQAAAGTAKSTPSAAAVPLVQATPPVGAAAPAAASSPPAASAASPAAPASPALSTATTANAASAAPTPSATPTARPSPATTSAASATGATPVAANDAIASPMVENQPAANATSPITPASKTSIAATSPGVGAAPSASTTASTAATAPATTATPSPAATPLPPAPPATPATTKEASPPAVPAITPAPATPPATPANSIPAPAATPYTFAAVKGADGATVMTGDVPTEQIKGYFGVVATDVTTTGLNVVSGAPASFVGDALKGLDALDELTTGELHYDGKAWSIKGQARTPTAQAAARAAIASLADSGNWMTAIEGPPPLEVCRQSVASFDTLNAVVFTSGTHLSPASGAALDTLAADLAQCPKARVDVEGNTDSDGDANANMALSVARAETVVAELVKRGVDPDRLYAIGYGETVPLVPNTTAKNKALNRRIGIEVEDGKDK